MKKLLLIVCIWRFVAGVTAQDYKYEAGGALGIGFYMGDANQYVPFHHMKAAYGLVFRHNINYRWAVKANLSSMRISGDTKDFSNVFPEGKQMQFSRQLFDLGAQMEFNFFNYGIGYSYLGTSRIAPYLLAGFGFTFSPSGGDHSFNVNIPLGVGVKYKLSARWNIGLEFTMRKTFGDKLDGKALDDPYLIESSSFKNTDWYSFTMFSVTYDFGYKKRICNNLQ